MRTEMTTVAKCFKGEYILEREKANSGALTQSWWTYIDRCLLPCLLRLSCAGKQASVRARRETRSGRYRPEVERMVKRTGNTSRR